MRIMILFFLLLSVLKAETITFVADEYCPYNCTPESENPGYLVEVLQSIFQEHDYEIKYVLANSFDESIEQTRNGKYNAILSVLKIDVPDFIFPEHAQGVVDNVFYTRKDSTWRYTGLDSLKEVKLGHISGYNYSKEIDHYIATTYKESNMVQSVSGPSAFLHNLKKLRYKQIDTLIEDRYVIEHHYKQVNEENPFKVAGRLFIKDLFIGFSPKRKESQKYAKILSDGMKTIQENGVLDAILKKYGLDKQEK